MFRSTLTFCALASLAVLGACGDNDNGITTPSNAATVRFINATGNSTITVAQNGSVAAGNSGIVFSNGSSCLVVDATNPGLTFTDASGNTITSFTPALATGGNFTVVAFTDANGNTQFATLNNAFSPTNGSAGLRVFNASSGSGNIVVLADGTVLNSGSVTAFGNAGTFFSNPSGSQTLTFNTGTGTAMLASTGVVNLTPGTNNTVFLAPAATGTTNLRAFVAGGC